MRRLRSRFKASETLLGIETVRIFGLTPRSFRFKASETLLGIETVCPYNLYENHRRFKASETLLGIETVLDCSNQAAPAKDSKPLKPF